MSGDNVVSLTAIISERRKTADGTITRIFKCIACGCYGFKLIEVDGDTSIACANCEAWIKEFDITPNQEIS